MTSLINQKDSSTSICCIDYCESKFGTVQNQIVNNYKCGQRPLSLTELWNIQRQRKALNLVPDVPIIASNAHP